MAVKGHSKVSEKAAKGSERALKGQRKGCERLRKGTQRSAKRLRKAAKGRCLHTGCSRTQSRKMSRSSACSRTRVSSSAAALRSPQHSRDDATLSNRPASYLFGAETPCDAVSLAQRQWKHARQRRCLRHEGPHGTFLGTQAMETLLGTKAMKTRGKRGRLTCEGSQKAKAVTITEVVRS